MADFQAYNQYPEFNQYPAPQFDNAPAPPSKMPSISTIMMGVCMMVCLIVCGLVGYKFRQMLCGIPGMGLISKIKEGIGSWAYLIPLVCFPMPPAMSCCCCIIFLC